MYVWYLSCNGPIKGLNDVCLSEPLRNHIMRMIKLSVRHLSVCLVGNLVQLCYRYANATFCVVKAPFTQLFGMHAFVKSGSRVKQVPLAFCLMSGKRKVDYVAVINSIIQLLPTPLAVRRVVLDFEAAMWEAVRDVDMLQHVEVKGCLFHHAQVINMARIYGTNILI